VDVKFDRNAVVGWTAGVCAGAAALAAVIETFSPRLHVAVLVLAAVATTALAVLIFIGLMPFSGISRWTRRPQPPSPEEIDQARVNLHAALSGAWSEEGSEVYEDVPMRVKFAPWTGVVTPQVVREAVRTDGPASKRSQTGNFNTVAETFARSPRYRRVVLGEAGAGKTVLVAELQRRLVEAPQPGDPLPVIVPAAAWRPDRQPLLEWLAQQLAADYGSLPVAHARALVARGGVLPILDGLDEMPSSLRPVAIDRINKYHVYRPLIVTSREDEYRDAIRKTHIGVKGSLVVAVKPLRPKDSRAYLAAASGDLWTVALGGMDSDKDGPLPSVLANPLMLWLTRVEYDGKTPNDLTLFGSRRSLENFLLRQFVPSVYAHDSRQAAATQFRCTAQQAKRWLGHLAWGIYSQYRSNQQTQGIAREDKEGGRQVDIGGAPLLAWWDIENLASGWRRLGMAVRAAVLSSVAVTLGIWVLEQRGNWRNGAYSGPVPVAGLLIDGPVGRLIQPTVLVQSRVIQEARGKGQLTQLIRILDSTSKISSVIFGHSFLIVLIVVFFASIVAITRPLGASIYPARLQIRTGAVLRALARCCFLFGAAALAAIWLLSAEHWPVSKSEFFGSRSTWITLITFSLLGLISLPHSSVSRSDAYGNISPDESLRLDRHADALTTVSGRFILAVAVWLICGPPMAIAYTGYAITATVLAFTLGGEQSFASRSYVDARNWLAVQGLIPWRTMTFLADASRRGVLRRDGAAYQFRHVRLLEEVGYWRSADNGGRLDRGRIKLGELLYRGKKELGELTEIALGQVEGRHDKEMNRITADTERCRQAVQSGVDVLPPEFIEILDNIASQLRWPSGEQSRAALRDVLRIYRHLANVDPAAFEPLLAKVLKESASAFRLNEALRVSNEAVDCYDDLARMDPAAFLPALASAVDDLAGWLRLQAADNQAQAGIKRAVGTCRVLAETDPTAFKPALARILEVSASAFRWDEALRVSNEAVDCYRDLARTDPAAFLSALAKATSDLAYRLIPLDRLQEALSLTSDIVDTARNQAENDPAVFLPILANSLHDLGCWLWKSGSRQEDSINAWSEATVIYRELTKADPARFSLHLSSSLENLMSAFRALGKEEDEIAAVRDALSAYQERANRIAEIRRQLAGQDLAVLLQHNKRTSAKRKFYHTYFEQYKRTLAAARFAALAYSKQAECQPTEFLPDLAQAARGLAIELKSVGERRAARILADEAARIRIQYRRSANITELEALQVGPLTQIDRLALRLWKLGEHQDAAKAGRVSCDLAPHSLVVMSSAVRLPGWPAWLLSAAAEY
jgi:hypothetical protein